MREPKKLFSIIERFSHRVLAYLEDHSFPAPPSVLIEEIRPVDFDQCKTCHYFNRDKTKYYLSCAVHPYGEIKGCPDHQEI